MIPQAYLTGREGWRAMKLSVPYRVPEGGIAFGKNYATPTRNKACQRRFLQPQAFKAKTQTDDSKEFCFQ